jgi:hypothetical protein
MHLPHLRNPHDSFWTRILWVCFESKRSRCLTAFCKGALKRMECRDGLPQAGGQKVLAEHQGDHIKPAVGAELRQDVRDAVADRRVADAQLVGNGRDRQTTGDQAEQVIRFALGPGARQWATTWAPQSGDFDPLRQVVSAPASPLTGTLQIALERAHTSVQAFPD